MAEIVEIRDVTPDDLPRLREIFLESRRQTFDWLDTSIYRLEDFDAQTAGEVVLVATVGGQPAAFISWWPAENFIHHLFVDHRFTQQGLGTALLSACLGGIGRPARLKCAARNSVALDFYAARGWQRAGSGTGDTGLYFLLELAS